MRHLIPSLATASLWLFTSSSVAAAPQDPTFSVRMTPGAVNLEATAVVRGLPGSIFAICAETSRAPGYPMLVYIGQLGFTGRYSHAVKLPDPFVRSGETVTMYASALRGTHQRVTSNIAFLGGGTTMFERFSADFGMNAASIQTGEIVAEQWSSVGLHVRAMNATGGPDMALAFDSAVPAGSDSDLATPGPGSGNDFAFGKVIIVAENSIDADGDGIIDDPVDAIGGGTLTFDWDDPILMSSVSLLDVDLLDQNGARVRTYLGGSEIQNVFVAPRDDNNLQVVALDPLRRIDELQVELSGSGALADVEFLPCPMILGFDASTTGIPFHRSAGEIAGFQWLAQGVSVSGVTADASAPDAVLVFDSAAPTGGDLDLVTPGYGPGNRIPYGQVLVLGDNVIDADGNGLVDDPGDSEFGGVLDLDFDVPVTLEQAIVLDVDLGEAGGYFEAFDESGQSLGSFPLLELGDNSAQVVSFAGLQGVRRLSLHLIGSGALAELLYCPTPER